VQLLAAAAGGDDDGDGQRDADDPAGEKRTASQSIADWLRKNL
jgi:hypothetical protein